MREQRNRPVFIIEGGYNILKILHLCVIQAWNKHDLLIFYAKFMTDQLGSLPGPS